MNMGAFPSGQWGQTVNLLLNASVVRIHQLPPTKRYLIMGIAFVLSLFSGDTLADSNSPGPELCVLRRAKTVLQAVFRARLANLPDPTKKCSASRDAEQKMTYSA